MPSPPVSSFSGFSGPDGARLAYREVGEGRPLVLLHGITGDAALWTAHGQAETIAAHGHRVILPDFRGHGRSAKPHDAAAYPPDVLTDDTFALLDHLGLDEGAYDLGGYSLGGRIVVRLLVRGAAPGRAVVAGQGLKQVRGAEGGAGSFLRKVFTEGAAFEPGSRQERAAQWLRSRDEDPVALLHVLDSIVATPEEPLGGVQVPTLVAVGSEDERADSADELAAAFPYGTRAVLPGDHTTATSAPEFVAAIVEFLAGHR
ncbi:Pimeloyl-ACP methyl ester carboxylesterase [Actinacidiphila yanglinensis]|uniref:Pimeloyl-ACP methyl ester carboxylesterase n=1 Tax=Actinacidiphila yanglinensis TaxID=310779 RepID=A0A1H5SI17_9ACTN|nr:alpha/beta hydrolase [Actinacidiphila yanglinensis]SEF50064.1 Pimeloyl-ACP methyl ester carboxylesterase [Actinacidiphila yanglinensis]